MKYAAEIGSGAVTYIPSFIQMDSGIQKLIVRDTQREDGTQSRLKSHIKF
jgi:hypothetical protein